MVIDYDPRVPKRVPNRDMRMGYLLAFCCGILVAIAIGLPIHHVVETQRANASAIVLETMYQQSRNQSEMARKYERTFRVAEMDRNMTTWPTGAPVDCVSMTPDRFDGELLLMKAGGRALGIVRLYSIGNAIAIRFRGGFLTAPRGGPRYNYNGVTCDGSTSFILSEELEYGSLIRCGCDATSLSCSVSLAYNGQMFRSGSWMGPLSAGSHGYVNTADDPSVGAMFYRCQYTSGGVNPNYLFP